jgi:hypothetical protein
VTGVIRRRIGLADPHPLLGFDGDSAKKGSGVLLASAAGVAVAGGVDEKQTITVTGTPTGGTFTLTFDGATTANIAYNASAAAVAAALALLPNVGAGNVAGTGGALPGTPVVITFQGALANRDVPQMTAAHAFTGGTNPAIAVTTTTPGSSIDSGILRAKRGLVLMAANGTGTDDKLVPWDGASATTPVGVLQDTVTFLGNTSPENDAPVAFYEGPGLTFNADVLEAVNGSNWNAGNFGTWASANGNRVGSQGAS